ncbi:pyrimidine 1 [Actinidia rufa]|uniref:Pyrimidine 1 n=1 Tax=Actinidia rufa TaxID=165716 RepID=A0A7J0DEH9_9ERIC|nr:pyrimidine 1 [Actinidia rufa]
MASLRFCGPIGAKNGLLMESGRVPSFQRRGELKVFASSSTQTQPDLSVTVNGLKMPNPFVIGSGPPGTNYTVMKRAFDEGWGAVIAKTVSRSFLD